MISPGEVADITFASRASVIVSLPWAEGDQGATRNVQAWMRVEVDGIVDGAWTARAHTAPRASGGGVGNNAAGRDIAGPGENDPGRTPAASGSAEPPPTETGAGGLRQWASAGFRGTEVDPEGSGAGDEGDGLAADCRSAAAQLLQPWMIDGGHG